MTNEERARLLAEQVREQRGLHDGPVKDLFELVHLVAEVDALSVEAGNDEHGLSMIDPHTGKAVIAVATTDNPMRQRSSIAHELGHVLAGDLDHPEPLEPGTRTPPEIRADAFARHLLVPRAGVQRRLAGVTGGATVAHLSELVQEFEASPHMVAIQLRELGYIDARTCAQWRALSAPHLATRFGWLSQYRSLAADSQQPRAPQGLMARAVDAYRRGLLGLGELALWYGQDRALLQAELGPPDDLEPAEDYWSTDGPLFPGGTPGPAS